MQEQIAKCKGYRRIDTASLSSLPPPTTLRLMVQTEFQARVDAATEASLFRSFPAAERERLFRSARRVDAPAGATLFLGASPQPGLVVEGVVKVFLMSPDGRQVTIHYLKQGGTVGILAMVGGPPPVRLQAITPTTLQVLDAAAVKAVSTSDVMAAWAVANEFASIYVALLNQVAVNVFGNVRQRVCNHLLNLATPAEDGSLVAEAVTQQELANAVGTAREVVSRTLGSLSRAGIVAVQRDRIAILDPAKMVNEVGTAISA